MPVREEEADEREGNRLRKARLEAQPIDQPHARFGMRMDAALMPPPFHRLHRRLFDEALALLPFNQGEIRAIDRDKAKEEEETSEKALTLLDVEIGERFDALWSGHPKKGSHLFRNPLHRGDPCSSAIRAHGKIGCKFELDASAAFRVGCPQPRVVRRHERYLHRSEWPSATHRSSNPLAIGGSPKRSRRLAIEVDLDPLGVQFDISSKLSAGAFSARRASKTLILAQKKNRERIDEARVPI